MLITFIGGGNMASALISGLANQWAQRIGREYPDLENKDRIAVMFEQAMGRKASTTELEILQGYLSDGDGDMTDLALAIINMKEFIYIR